MDKLISQLKTIKGLIEIKIVEDKNRKEILKREKKQNKGVLCCLKKRYVLLVTHNSEFRDPYDTLVKIEENEIIFPALSFSELAHIDAISSSPSKEVHDFLVKAYNLEKNKNHATLLIAFEELPESTHKS